MLMSLPSPPSVRFALTSSLSSAEHFSLLPRASPLLLACRPGVSHSGHQALGHAPSPAEPSCQACSRSNLLRQKGLSMSVLTSGFSWKNSGVIFVGSRMQRWGSSRSYTDIHIRTMQMEGRPTALWTETLWVILPLFPFNKDTAFKSGL